MRFLHLGIIRMNILIVGNGFDLSHYLPTKYDHFIKVMTAIENWSKPNQNMKFDDLYNSLYRSESWFFDKSRSLYLTEEIEIDFEEIKTLKVRLQENVWYQFFKHHLNEIDTWIDFEIEFSEALDLVAKFNQDAEKKYEQFEVVRSRVFKVNQNGYDQYLKYWDKTIKKLILLRILCVKDGFVQINVEYYRNNKIDLDIDAHKLIGDLEENLESFIEIFDWYLANIIEKLNLKNKIFKNNLEFFSDDLTVLSFNYTNTFKRLYDSTGNVEYIHGQVGKRLVLGIPDLKNEFLKKFKNYSFTKYHQKLLKNTDYLFLEENQTIKNMFETRTIGLRKINISIWGHSLAESDESYIREIFSLNRNDSVECRVVVYFYRTDAPQLLNNLLDILDKELVERWMKKGWLRFEPNLEINFGV